MYLDQKLLHKEHAIMLSEPLKTKQSSIRKHGCTKPLDHHLFLAPPNDHPRHLEEHEEEEFSLSCIMHQLLHDSYLVP
jgi:hypothetical protein